MRDPGWVNSVRYPVGNDINSFSTDHLSCSPDSHSDLNILSTPILHSGTSVGFAHSRILYRANPVSSMTNKYKKGPISIDQLPLPLDPSIKASQPISRAFCATRAAINWRVIEVETG